MLLFDRSSFFSEAEGQTANTFAPLPFEMHCQSAETRARGKGNHHQFSGIVPGVE
jgi:hypothetical protein